MVEQHGGDIAIKSREGEGTRIIVNLPIDYSSQVTLVENV
jgi:signal transduction histidine kinase